MSELPSGFVTFMFTDIEGSTRLHHRWGSGYAELLTAHDQLLLSVIRAHRGVVVTSLGDGLFAAFSSSADAVDAGVAIQRALAGHVWPVPARVSVRIGLHAADAEPRDGNYVSLGVHRASRVASAANGGQILVTDEVLEALAELPPGTTVRDWGRFQLKDFPEPVRLHGLESTDGPQGEVPRARPATAHNVPVLRTSFVGRDYELSSLRTLLSERPGLVTVLGPGGVGKTRLLFELVKRAAEDYRDGAWVLLLASLRDRDQFESELVTTFGLRPDGEQAVAQALIEHLRDRQVLIAFDNCEHLVDAVAEMSDAVLSACPEVTLVTTSREPLLVGGERLWRLTPFLDERTGEASRSALGLFVDRAAAATGTVPDLSNDTTQRWVAEICAGLDGLPLAIELAAGQLRRRGLATLHAQLGDLLRVPGGNRRGDDRHHTLERTIRWSYDLLEPEVAETFRNLAVFRSGFTASDAAEVLHTSREEVEDVLFGLVDKSLLVLDITEEAAFRMLVTVRQFAAQQLDSDPVRSQRLRDGHADWATTRAEQIAQGLSGRDSDAHAVAGDRHHPNCLAALEHSHLHQDGGRLSRLAMALFAYWLNRWLTVEAATWLARAAQQANDPSLRLRLRANACFFTSARGGSTADTLTECLAIRDAIVALQPDEHAAHASLAIGELLSEAREFNLAEECLEYALEHAVPEDQAGVHNGMGLLAVYSGDPERAMQQFGLALDAYRSLGLDYPASIARSNLAEVLADLGRYEEAAHQIGPWFDNPRAAPRQVICDVLRTKAAIQSSRGQTSEGLETLREALRVARETRSQRAVDTLGQKLKELEAANPVGNR